MVPNRENRFERNDFFKMVMKNQETLGVADSLQTLVSLSRHERLIPQGRGRFFITQTARRPKKVF